MHSVRSGHGVAELRHQQQTATSIIEGRSRSLMMPDTITATRVDVQMPPMTGSEVVLEALAEQGVEVVFGYPGGAVLPIYDAIFKQDRIRHILVRHEQGAVHAAEGYARSSGKVGVILVTSGPGATNTVT